MHISPYFPQAIGGYQPGVSLYGQQPSVQWLQALPQQIQQLQQLSYTQQQQLQQLLQIAPAQLAQLAQVQQVIQYIPQQIQQLLQLVAQQQFGVGAPGALAGGVHQQGFNTPFQTVSPFGASYAGTPGQVM